MNQAKEEKLLEIRVRQRRLILEYQKEISSAFRKIEEEAHEELQSNLEKIRNDYAELIETDRHLDSAQLVPLVPEQARVDGPSEHEPKITDLEPVPSSPILGREMTLLSPEVKDSTSTSRYISHPEYLVYWLLTYISERSRSFGSLPDNANSGSDSRIPNSLEPLHKKSSKWAASCVETRLLTGHEEMSPATVQQSDAEDSDSTGDLDEEIPHRVPNPKNTRSFVTPDPGVDQPNGPASSIQAVPGSFLSSSLSRQNAALRTERIKMKSSTSVTDTYESSGRRQGGAC